MRHDAHLWIRHDAHRFLTPAGIEAERQAAEARARADLAAEQKAFEDELWQVRRDLDALKAELAVRRAVRQQEEEALRRKSELAWRELCRKYGYNPDQPRRPKGDPEGPGEWVKIGGAEGADTPKVRLAAMSWEERVKSIFGQKDLFTEVGAGRGGGGGAPNLPLFRGNGPTAGVLRTQKGDTQIVSGSGGPASKMPEGARGFDGYTRKHVEGHAAAIMEKQGAVEGTLFLNNPPCPNCNRNLRYMLRPGARLDVNVVPTGARFRFFGVGP